MPTVGTSYTLKDIAASMDPDGSISAVAELLEEQNEVLMDMPWIEGNLPTGHKSIVRTGLPAAAWRKLGYGVQPSKSITAPVTDTCGMLETYSEIDKSLAKLNGNEKAFRVSEGRAFLEGMNQAFASSLFYGNTETDPEQFMGLAARYDSISTDKTKIGYNVISGSGAAVDNTSIWFVTWGKNTIHGIYPKGSKAGLEHEDLGQVTLADASGGLYEGMRDHYKWDCGLVVRDWRAAGRIANIDVSELLDAGEAAFDGAELIHLMIRLMGRLKGTNLGKGCWYVNREVKTALDLLAMSKSNVQLSISEMEGKPVTSFLGYPIRICEGILNSEAVVA